MLDRIWDFFVDSCMAFFLPIVSSYFALSGNLFLNVSCDEAAGLEKWSNQILAPVHYAMMGRSAHRSENGEWEFHPRFEYKENFGAKSAASAIAFIPSFFIGTAAKAASFLDPAARARHREMKTALHSTETRSNLSYYRSLGLDVGGETSERLIPQGYQRRPGDENHLAAEKKALKEITDLFTKAEIPWWVDCGTCLGAYRYGGAIPWDGDIDIAVLLPDFSNVLKVLNHLDPKKYIVEDWSSRDFPESYIKVFVRQSNTLIDIYHFKIDPEKKEIEYILTLENAIFFPEWSKIREKRFKVPAAFDTVFPLKKGTFDGIEVYVPNNTEKYLQRYYGENLNPAKIFDPLTGQYEKDVTHPYWQRAHVH